MVDITYRDALRQALNDAMEADETVFVMGEEVGAYGGAYGVTKDLIKKFGPERLLDTPISEAGIVGAAVGAAMTGLRPVVELMYIDFLGLTMDQLGNQAAKIRYMFGGQIGVPLVLADARRHRSKRGRAAFAKSRSLDHAYAGLAPRSSGDRFGRLSSPAAQFDACRTLWSLSSTSRCMQGKRRSTLPNLRRHGDAHWCGAPGATLRSSPIRAWSM